MKKRIRLQGIIILLAIILAIFFQRHLLAYRSSSFLVILGVILVLAGYYLRILARGLKADRNPDGKTLITHGIYSLTRNPMYLGTFLIGAGVVSAIFRWWVGIIFLAVYLSIYIPQMRKEEKVLSERFGETFSNYCQQVPQFLPLIRPLALGDLRINARWLNKELPSLALTLSLVIFRKFWECYH